MSTPITRPPLGLLDLVGTKTLGLNPNELLDQVRGTLDIARLTLLGRYELLSSFGLPVGFPVVPGFADAFTVPQNELWYVHTVAVQVIPAGGFSCFLQPAAGRIASVQIPYVAQPGFATPSTIAFGMSAVDWWLPAGFSLGAWIASATGVGVTYDIHAMVTKLLV